MTDRAGPHTSGKPWEDDAVAFNRWLCVSRVRAATAVAIFFPILSWLGHVDVRVAPVLAVCGALIAFSLAVERAPRFTARTRAFFWTQLVVDLTAITVGIGFAAHGTTALLARPLYVAAIVPCGLISVPVGLAAAALASLGHALLLVHESGLSLELVCSLGFLLPIFLFFLVAQQSFVYGAHLREKNAALEALAQRLEASQRRLAEEGRLAAGIAEIARTLSASLDDPEPMGRVVSTIRERLWADWCAMFGVDEEERFRLLAVSDPEVGTSHVDRISLPIATWPTIERLRDERALALREPAVAAIPSSLCPLPLRSALLAGLYHDRDMIGFVAVGHRTPLDGAEPWATHLLAGIAEHASIVLQNARLLDEVRAASNLKSEFVGAVSHELRSPLNVILGYVEMLLDEALGPLTAEQRDALVRAGAQAGTLLEMIETLLDLNRLDAGRLPLEHSEVSLAVLLGDICDQLGRALARPGVELRCELEAGVATIVTDPGKLKTIVRNLVHNALKFTERGTVRIVAQHGEPGDVRIVVEDSGCGIPADALQYVFDMFRQVPGSGGGGVGLGLHIVRRLAEAIGATVTVTSDVGVGSRFTVRLPGAVAPQPAHGRALRDRAA
jgi:signal transduction histidine kinase